MDAQAGLGGWAVHSGRDLVGGGGRTKPEYLYECTCIRLFGSAVNCTQSQQQRQSQKRPEPGARPRRSRSAPSHSPAHPTRPRAQPPTTARTRASLPCPFRWRMKQFCFLVSIQIRSADIFVVRLAVNSTGHSVSGWRCLPQAVSRAAEKILCRPLEGGHTIYYGRHHFENSIY